MSYNQSVPLNSDSPSIFPSQAQTNWGRLATIVGADHQFNLAAAGNDGYHNLIHMTQQAPSGALASTGRMYVKTSAGQINLFYMDDAAREFQLSPGMPIRAAVNFNGDEAIGAQTIRSQYNVTSVTKTDVGLYTIVFTNAMPNTDYIVQITGMRDGSSNQVFGFIQSNNTVTNSMTTTTLKVGFASAFGGGNFRSVLVGNVTILSVT